jgi:2-isopropylmalate synthase
MRYEPRSHYLSGSIMNTLKRKINILDTTLRDGDHSPGISFGAIDKLEIALILEKLGVDIIEAGSISPSFGELNTVKEIAYQIRKCAISVMVQAIPGDIETAGEVLADAAKRYIHINLPISPTNSEYKLKKTNDKMINMAIESIALAKSLADVVEIGLEDATRTEYKFLAEFCCAITETGAGIVNISDTVGYAQPTEFSKLIKNLLKDVPGFACGTSTISVHCYNDLGLALANTLAGLLAGAGQAECTLLGIGERAGNAPLEELVTAISVREDYYRSIYTGVSPEFFGEAARVVSRATAIGPHPCKPVVGANAFSHGSSIHQHGMAENGETYSFIKSGKSGSPFTFVLSRHSGHRGLKEKIKEIADVEITDDDVSYLFIQFQKIADNKKVVSATDVLLLLHEYGYIKTSVWDIKKIYYFDVQSADKHEFSAFVELVNQNGTEKWINKSGATKWEAIISAMKTAFHFEIKIIDFSTSLYSDGSAWSERFRIEVEFEGNVYTDESYGNDSLILFVESYLNIVNKLIVRFQFADGD